LILPEFILLFVALAIVAIFYFDDRRKKADDEFIRAREYEKFRIAQEKNRKEKARIEYASGYINGNGR
jgi:hypothetical protein